MSPKKQTLIIHAGWGRAGSGSLAYALQVLGYDSVWHFACNQVELNEKGLTWWYDNRICQRLDANDKTVDLNEWIQLINCNVLLDTPLPLYWEHFYEQFPDSNVIVTTRKFDDLYQSRTRTSHTLWNNKWFKFVTLITKLPYWFEHVYVPRFTNNIGLCLNDDKCISEKLFNKRMKEIKDKVPSAQLLIFNVKDGWKPLCQFLNKPIPKESYPHSNKREGFVWMIFRCLGLIKTFRNVAKLIFIILFIMFIVMAKAIM